MSDSRDYPDEMTPLRELDDATAEAVLRGDVVPAEFESLVTAVAALRAAPELPVQPSVELAARMAAGDFASAVASPRRRRSAGRHTARYGVARRRLVALPVPAKVATIAVLAVGGLTTATAAGALPEPAQQRMQSVIESVTPINFPEPTDSVPVDSEPVEQGPADFGRDTAEDARDGGVDGREVSEKARQLGQPDRPAHRPSDRPTPPAKAQRPEVPAGPKANPGLPAHVPADPPGEPGTPGGAEPPNPQNELPVAPPARE